jgi:hypothetical protein
LKTGSESEDESEESSEELWSELLSFDSDESLLGLTFGKDAGFGTGVETGLALAA